MFKIPPIITPKPDSFANPVLRNKFGSVIDKIVGTAPKTITQNVYCLA